MTFPAAPVAQHLNPPPALASERVRDRLRAERAPFRANDNISRFLCDGDLEDIQCEAEGHLAAMLRALVIDTDTDHNTVETAKRVAKMYVREVFAGRYAPEPRVTDFPNAAALDEVYAVGPIEVRSACSHHLVPILGQAWIGVLPGDRVIGLSKFARLAEWVLGRPQIQEEATVMLADTIEELVQPHGLALVVRARHLCCGWRGVRDSAQMMTTRVMRGAFQSNDTLRREFLAMIAGQGH